MRDGEPNRVDRAGAGTPASGVAPDDGPAHEPLTLLLQLRARLIRVEELVRDQRRAREFYSTAEVAEILGKAEFTVREWCRRGRVRAEKKQSGRGKYPCWVISDAELKRIQKEGLLPG